MALFVAETKVNSEAQAVRQLGNQGFEAFYPRCRVKRVVRGSEQEFLKALFPRYVFVELDLSRDQWRSVNGTFGVRRLLCNDPEHPLPVPEAVAAGLRARREVQEADPLDVLRGLERDSRVRVLDGPFMDQMGRVEGLDDQGRVIVLMYMLGRVSALSFGRSQLEAV